MKLGQVTKPDKRNLKKIVNDTISANCDISHFSNLWPIWSNPEARSWMQSVKLTFSLTVTFYLTINLQNC